MAAVAAWQHMQELQNAHRRPTGIAATNERRRKIRSRAAIGKEIDWKPLDYSMLHSERKKRRQSQLHLCARSWFGEAGGACGSTATLTAANQGSLCDHEQRVLRIVTGHK